jgi:hypothetical protein
MASKIRNGVPNKRSLCWSKAPSPSNLVDNLYDLAANINVQVPLCRYAPRGEKGGGTPNASSIEEAAHHNEVFWILEN